MGGRSSEGGKNTWYKASSANVEGASIGDKMRVTRAVGIRQREETVEYTLQTETISGHSKPSPVWVPDSNEWSRIRFGSDVTDLFNDSSVKEVLIKKKK